MSSLVSAVRMRQVRACPTELAMPTTCPNRSGLVLGNDGLASLREWKCAGSQKQNRRSELMSARDPVSFSWGVLQLRLA